jgi:hypothetical protein
MAKTTMNITDIIDRQTDAYNARDLAGFAAFYADSIRIYRMPGTEPVISGKTQLLNEYKTRFRAPMLHADIISRISLGNKVIDHERVSGILALPIEGVAVYEVTQGLIQNVWFYFGGAESPLPRLQ